MKQILPLSPTNSRRRTTSQVVRTLTGLLLFVLACCGCADSKTPPATSDGSLSASVSQSGPSSAADTSGNDTNVQIYWDAIFVGNEHAGFTRTTIRTFEQDREFDSFTQLEIKRFGNITRQTMEIRGRETLDHRIKDMTTVMTSAGNCIESIIRNDGSALEIITRAGSNETKTKLSADALSPIAVEQDLMQRPMREGETRTYRQFMPFMNTLARVTLIARQKERTKLLNGAAELLRVDSTMLFEGGNSTSIALWINDRGETVKTELAGIQTTYRTTQQVAQRQSTKNEFDFGIASLAKTDKPIANPHQTRRARYLVIVAEDENAAGHLWNGDYQHVNARGPDRAEVTVLAQRPDRSVPHTIDTVPREFTTANAIIEATDPAIQELAAQVEAGDDVWETVCNAERFVFELITKKNFSTSFATAKQTALTRSGDCTEHAVLLCALCRAKGIPAKCTVGLVYYAPSQAFGFHMWTEAWCHGKWIPVDATLGLGGIGAAHIKVSDTSFRDGNGFESMLPVLQLIGRLSVNVLEIE